MATGEGYYELKINKWPTQLRVLQRSEVPELIAEGLALTPLVLATPERIEAIADMVLCWKREHGETPHYLIVHDMLAEMKGEAHDE